MLWFLGGFALGAVTYRTYGVAIEEMIDAWRNKE